MEENAFNDVQEVNETPEVEINNDTEESYDDYNDVEGSDDSDLSVEERLAKLEEQNGILRRKLTKAEKAKQQKVEAPKAQPKQELSQDQIAGVSMDDLFMIQAMGINDATDVKHAQKIAQVEGVSLKEALQSDQFKYWHKAAVQKRKEEAAALGASSGSGRHRRPKSFKGQYLTKNDHKKLWQQRMSGNN